MISNFDWHVILIIIKTKTKKTAQETKKEENSENPHQASAPIPPILREDH